MGEAHEVLATVVSAHLDICSKLLVDTAFAERLAGVCDVIEHCLRTDHTLYFAGNGGSAAAASHFMTELVGRFRRSRSGFRSVSLCSDAALLTALTNDFPASELFSRQVAALGRQGDVLICLTTSGRSANIIAALKTAAALQISPITFCGSYTAEVGDYGQVISVPSEDTPRIQEIHELLLHVITEQVENALAR